MFAESREVAELVAWAAEKDGYIRFRVGAQRRSARVEAENMGTPGCVADDVVAMAGALAEGGTVWVEWVARGATHPARWVRVAGVSDDAPAALVQRSGGSEINGSVADVIKTLSRMNAELGQLALQLTDRVARLDSGAELMAVQAEAWVAAKQSESSAAAWARAESLFREALLPVLMSPEVVTAGALAAQTWMDARAAETRRAAAEAEAMELQNAERKAKLDGKV